MPWPWNKKRKFVPAPQGPAMSCMRTGYCSKEACPLWIVYDTKSAYGNFEHKPQGKCAWAWMPQLTIEARDTVQGAILNKPAHVPPQAGNVA